uniref:USP6 N-terminal-like protein n=1 Tax=Gouania willdenowi TaxID=441366 RepID=A0A8C5EQB0_GOUWI
MTAALLTFDSTTISGSRRLSLNCCPHFLAVFQIERFIRMGIPPSLRARVWKCVLTSDNPKDSRVFNYQTCLSEVRGPLVDLGVSEYGILSAITTLSETQNELDLNHQQSSSSSHYSLDDITLFRQIALDLQRSFPTHRSLMGDRPEAIEGQAKLFRVLIAYARYNPSVGYSQGMSYITAVLLMQLAEEEEAFWALAALLDKPKYLADLFDLKLTGVQHQVKVFDQLLKHRKPQLSTHLESMGVLSVHYVTPWFLTLFTSLPCWDSVLAVWDLIILHGLPAVFRIALTIIDLLEHRLIDQNDEGAVLPLLLRVPVDIAQYNVLVPALWNTEIQDWELKCMNNLVLDESHQGPKADESNKPVAALTSQNKAATGKENVSSPLEGTKTTEKGAKSVLKRVIHLAQRYFLEPMGRQQAEGTNSQTGTERTSIQKSPAAERLSRSKTLASVTEARRKSRRRSKQRIGAHVPAVDISSVDDTTVAVGAAAGSANAERPEQMMSPVGESVGKVAHRRGNHSIAQQVRVKSLRLLRNTKSPLTKSPPSSSVLPPSLRSTTLPPSFSHSVSNPQPSTAHRRESRTAFVRELSSRHQSSAPFRNVRESKLI